MTNGALYLFLLLVGLMGAHTCFSIDVLPRVERYVPDYSVYHSVDAVASSLADVVRHHQDIMTLHSPFTVFISAQQRTICAAPLNASATGEAARVLIVAGEVLACC